MRLNPHAICFNYAEVSVDPGNEAALHTVRRHVASGRFGTDAIDTPSFRSETPVSFLVNFGSHMPPVAAYRAVRLRDVRVRATYFNPFWGYGGVVIHGVDRPWNFPKECAPAADWPEVDPLFEAYFPEWFRWFDHCPASVARRAGTRALVASRA